MSFKKSPDFLLFVITITLLVIGVFIVYDASYATAGVKQNDSYYFVKRQGLFAAIGLVALFVGMNIPYWKLRTFDKLALWISIVGLGLVFVPGLGVTVDGATRWIKFPILNRFQPSELAKLGLILYMASHLASLKRGIRDQKEFVWSLIPLIPIAALIMKEPDMGTTIITCVTVLVMIFIAGARRKHMLGVVSLGFILGALLIVTSPYRLERVISFLNPFKDYFGDGYQVCRSLIGMGSGGPLGVGICEGREKLFYLPAQHTDFIFAVLGEETGLVGTLFVSALFLTFGVRGFLIAFSTKDAFGRLLASGVSALVSGQALLNMLVVTSSVPATGVPFPFISYGGSSLILNLFCVGILLSVSRYPVPMGTRK